MAMKNFGLLIGIALSLMLIPKSHAKTNFKITSILNKPLMMLKNDATTGNDRYEGFLPELLVLLSNRIDFDYKISLVADGKYGAQSDDGKTWSGMIGEVLNNTADIAVADITINTARTNAVDFSHPFMTSGIGILMKKPVPADSIHPSFFLQPFTKEVWMCLLIACIGYSIVFFLLARFNSAEWEPCGTSERENNLAVCNALYFTFSSLTLQNAKVSPRGFSTRVLASVWWLFSIIVICSYIANLSAILVAHMDIDVNVIHDAESLSEQEKVKYGTLTSGSTFGFFKTSTVPLYQFIFQEMEKMSPSTYVKTYAEGIERVKKGNYALFMEHASIEYQISNDCDLMSVGGVLDYKAYGFAFRKNHVFLKTFSNEILKLQDEGELLKLRLKWWGKSGNLCEDEDPDKGRKLSLHSLHGPFILLPIGVIVAVVLTIIELFWRAKNSRGEGESMCGEVVREAKFALCGSGSNPRASDKHNGPHGESIILERQDAV